MRLGNISFIRIDNFLSSFLQVLENYDGPFASKFSMEFTISELCIISYKMSGLSFCYYQFSCKCLMNPLQSE